MGRPFDGFFWLPIAGVGGSGGGVDPAFPKEALNWPGIHTSFPQEPWCQLSGRVAGGCTARTVSPKPLGSAGRQRPCTFGSTTLLKSSKHLGTLKVARSSLPPCPF